jgi:hypothetical protein
MTVHWCPIRHASLQVRGICRPSAFTQAHVVPQVSVTTSVTSHAARACSGATENSCRHSSSRPSVAAPPIAGAGPALCRRLGHGIAVPDSESRPAGARRAPRHGRPRSESIHRPRRRAGRDSANLAPKRGGLAGSWVQPFQSQSVTAKRIRSFSPRRPLRNPSMRWALQSGPVRDSYHHMSSALENRFAAPRPQSADAHAHLGERARRHTPPRLFGHRERIASRC